MFPTAIVILFDMTGLVVDLELGCSYELFRKRRNGCPEVSVALALF